MRLEEIIDEEEEQRPREHGTFGTSTVVRWDLFYLGCNAASNEEPASPGNELSPETV